VTEKNNWEIPDDAECEVALNEDEFNRIKDRLFKGDRPIVYIMTPLGLFMYRNNGIWATITPMIHKLVEVKDSSESALREQTRLMHDLPVIPKEIYRRVITFFAAVNDEHSSECMVHLYISKDRTQWAIDPPKQEAKGLYISHYDPPASFKGYSVVGTIHSHCDAPAFQSGIDSADEKDRPGIHITFGNVSSELPSVHVRICADGLSFVISQEEIFPYLEIEQTVETHPWLKFVKKTSYVTSYKSPTYNNGTGNCSSRTHYGESRDYAKEREERAKKWGSDAKKWEEDVELLSKASKAALKDLPIVKTEDDFFEDENDDTEVIILT